MANPGSVVVVGATSEIGKQIAQHYAARGHKLYVTSRDLGKAQAVAAALGAPAEGLAVDLAQPHSIAAAFAGIKDVEHLVLVAIDRDENTVSDYNVDGGIMLVTLKLVGYTEAVHALLPEMRKESSVLMFGGLAKERPYPGSTTVTTVNGGVATLIRSMALEIAPIRVNALHPAVVGDSPYWIDKPKAVIDNLIARTPLGRLITIADVVDASIFLLENRGVTGTNLHIDGGWLAQ